MNFFESVLPAAGAYCAAYGVYDTSWWDTPQDFGYPVRLSYEGDSYFLPSSFRSKVDHAGLRAKRDGANAYLRRAFILDIDVREPDASPDARPNPFFSDKTEALQALIDKINDGTVPNPSYIVDTGGGFHVYWLGADRDPAAFAERNNAFTGFLKSALPSQLTADITTSKRGPGLYRVPGTYNRKYTPNRMVRVLSDSGVRHEEWIAALPHASSYAPETPQGAGISPVAVPIAMAWDFPRPDYVNRVPRPPICEGLVEHREHSHEAAYEGCAQYRWLHDKGPAELPAGQTYTPWWDMSIIMRRFPDGVERYDAWSSQFPGYDPDEAYRKVTEGAARVITCGRFAEDVGDPGRSRCLGCAFFRAGSPGTPMEAAEVRAVPDVTPRVALPVERLDGEFTCLEAAVALPEFLALDQDGSPKNANGRYLVDMKPNAFGLYAKAKVETDAAGKPVNRPRVLISSEPFFLLSRGIRADAGGKTERSQDKWAAMRADGTYAVQYLSTSAIMDSMAFRKEANGCALVTIGAGVTPTALGSYLNEVLNAYTRAGGSGFTTYRQLGWSEDFSGFVIGDRRYSGNRQYTPVVTETDDTMAICGIKGELSKQVEALRHYEDPEVSDTARAMLAFSAGAPLLAFMEEGNTIMVHAYSASGGGKTSMQQVCASLFGQPAIHASGKDTANSGEHVIATLRNLPVMYDELETDNGGPKRGATNSMTASFIRALSSDTERKRGHMSNTGAGYVVNVPLTYCTHVIASSNLRLDQLLPGASLELEAAKARLLHLDNGHSPLTPKSQKWQHRYDQINAALKHNYGHIGALLVDHFVTHRDEVVARVHLLRDKLSAVAANPHVDRMKILSTACAMVAGEVMQSMGWFMTSSLWTKKAVDRLRQGDEVTPVQAPAPPPAPAHTPMSRGPIEIGAVPQTAPAMAAHRSPPASMSASALFTDMLGQNYASFVRVQNNGATPMALGPPQTGNSFYGVVVNEPGGGSTIYVRAMQFARYCAAQSRGSGVNIDPEHLLRQWVATDPDFSANQTHSFPDVARAQDFPGETYHAYRRTA